MARKKLSEYKAKRLLYDFLEEPYLGVSLSKYNKSLQLDKTKRYVVKVDQGVKKRGKNKLIQLNVKDNDVLKSARELSQKGYSQFLIEEFIPHKKDEEKYLSLELTRNGILARYSQKGGIDIEENLASIHEILVPDDADKQQKVLDDIAKILGMQHAFLTQLVAFFITGFFSFLEINPIILQGRKTIPLDLAAEVDSAGEFFVTGMWTREDFVEPNKKEKTEEEKVVAKLKENSQASLKLDVFNPNGSLFTLLSGGGASITLADEAYNQGFGKLLANYADYSGNPNQEETYLYTRELLSLLLASKAKKKALVIAGGVANFTDVRVTFRGILQALSEVGKELEKQKVKVFVRRGGPNQVKGLTMMSDFLTQHNLLGGVWDQTMVLTDVIGKALTYVRET